MRSDLSSDLLATIGAIAVVFAVAVSTILIRYGEGYFEPTYELTAVFPTSTQGLFTDGGTDVKMRGVNVGTVSGVELLDDGRARLSFAIDEGVEVPATVAARIEPLSVLGRSSSRSSPSPDRPAATCSPVATRSSTPRSATSSPACSPTPPRCSTGSTPRT